MNSEQSVEIEPFLRKALDWIKEVQGYETSLEEGWRAVERLKDLTTEDLLMVMKLTLDMMAQMLMVCSDLNFAAFISQNPGEKITLGKLVEHWKTNGAATVWREKVRRYQASKRGSDAM